MRSSYVALVNLVIMSYKSRPTTCRQGRNPTNFVLLKKPWLNKHIWCFLLFNSPYKATIKRALQVMLCSPTNFVKAWFFHEYSVELKIELVFAPHIGIPGNIRKPIKESHGSTAVWSFQNLPQGVCPGYIHSSCSGMRLPHKTAIPEIWLWTYYEIWLWIYYGFMFAIKWESAEICSDPNTMVRLFFFTET